jgi:cell pole-organizing protein PopZ
MVEQMSDAKSPPDLSMDEILAQIRRIIAEDDHSGAPSAISRATTSRATMSGATAGSAAAAGAATHGAPTRSSADVGGTDAGAAEDTAGAGGDIVELTEAINEDGSVRHLAPRASAAAEPAPSHANERSPTPLPEPVDAPDAAAAPGERLVSDAASSASSTAFTESSPQREVPLGAGGRTLEDIVRDLLRPMVQTWLDQHLAEIVERLVQAEIAGVGKSGPA